ncbi:CRISPR-associated endonuclease Cas2 [Candidatus Woesearchaeota archaeon]|nr:CRISPR-associated endonuclease Cas2 [Candidatus Woesearchaeota archaeon]
MIEYIIIYDVPRDKKSMQVKINRKLKAIGAEMIQYSTWESKDLKGLKEVAKLVKQVDGDAIILEKKVVF